MNELTRRQALRTLSLAAGAASLSTLPHSHLYAQTPTPFPGIHFGVQLNAFPIDPKNFDTFMATLHTIQTIGYQGFESSFRNLSQQFAAPQAARRQIESTGLTFFGIHVFLDTPSYDPATRIAPAAIYEPVARGGAALGAKHLVLSGAPADNHDQLQRKIEALNAAGAYAKSLGITAAYHNHWPEFESKIGEIDALYSQTDPALVSFVLDAGHAYRGGADVPAFLRAHSQRLIGLHLRDYKNGRLISLGQGTFPLAQVAATVKQIGWHGWVENEEERENLSKTGLEVIAPAYKAMKEAFSA